MRHLTNAVACLLALCVLAGCRSKVDFEKSFTLGLGDVQWFEVDGPKMQQKIAVSVTADGPVNVHVAIAANQKAIEETLRADKLPDATKLLAFKEKAQTETIEATVPANANFVVFVSGAKKKTDVKVKITSK
jgi:hypothetical protein